MSGNKLRRCSIETGISSFSSLIKGLDLYESPGVARRPSEGMNKEIRGYLKEVVTTILIKEGYMHLVILQSIAYKFNSQISY